MNLRYTLAAAFLLLFFQKPFSQGITLDITGGYNVPLAPQTESVERIESQDSVFPFYYSTYAKVKGVSYGQGGNVALNLNWYSKKNIGFGLKANAFFGQAFNHSVYVDAFPGLEYYEYRSKSFSFQFIPHLCFRHDYKVVSPVLEAGMILGIAYIDNHFTATASYTPQVLEGNARDYGNVLIGFYSSLGLSFNVSKVVKLNVAVNCNAASYTPSHWKLTSFTVDGVSKMSALSTSQLQGDYVSELDLKAYQPPNVPSKDVKSSVAFSSVGFNAGICFRLGEKKEKKETKKDKPNTIHPF